MVFKKLSIIIPVYNEEEYIEETLRTVIASNSLGLAKEIIVIDDGSSDKSKIKIQSASRVRLGASRRVILLTKYKNTHIKILSNKNNQGKGASLKKGFLESTGDIVLIQDADCEYNPADYPALLEPFFFHEADVVYGSRFVTNRPHRVLYFWHYFANIILTFMSNILTNLNITDIETGYKVFRGELIRTIAPKLVSRGFGFEPEITARIAKIPGLKIYEVGISYYGRTYAEGKKIRFIDGIKTFFQIIRFNLSQ